jgi:signal transduction histidine kinase
LTTVITQLLQDYEAIADQRNITLEKEWDTQEILLQVDLPIFQRILGNLLSNAIKFSPDDGTVRVIARGKDPNFIQISFEDQGPGVEDDLKLRIFEPYETGTMMPNIAQIGLGLAFCKMMSKAHGGTIAVKDNCPQGAILRLTVPRRPPASQACYCLPSEVKVHPL